MINAETCFLECINSPVRSIKGRVELFNGSTYLKTFKHTDALKSFSVERVGEGKFFGFGICQKLNVHLRDVDREIEITTDNTLEAVFGTGSDYIYTFPYFKVTEVHRDENTNELSITAYDALYQANKLYTSQLDIETPYTIKNYASACANLLGLPLTIEGVEDNVFNTVYEGGANFEGSETIREALNAIADATQTIYYINNSWRLVFKRLDRDGEPVATIGKDKYFELNSKTNRRLAGITHATELGDNVSAMASQTGTIQYVRDNPFWDMREDVDTLVSNALAAVEGLTINQFDCSWRGNYLFEIGDKLAFVTKDNKTAVSFLLDDTIEYDGGLSQNSQWQYAEDEATENNPVSLGDALKQTYARVDKANKQIDLVASQVDANSQSISSLQMNTDNITATVTSLKEDTSTALENVNGEIATLTNKVEASITSEDVSIQISSALENGVSKVETTTGFTFNEEGLTVSKSGSEMTTTITEDGMTVYRDGDAVLIADNEGVKAEDLHATTYLIVGAYSRFEDYGNRTGCFWIG